MPKQIIKEFLCEMLDWEDWFYEVVNSPEYDADQTHAKAMDILSRDKIRNIIEKYLTKHAQETIGAATIVALATSKPRNYSQVIVEENDSPSELEVFTKNTRNEKKCYQYLLKDEDGQIKIDKAFFSYAGQPWIKKESI